MLQVFNDTARYVDKGDAKRKRPFNKDSKHADIAEFLKLKNNHLETVEGKTSRNCCEVFGVKLKESYTITKLLERPKEMKIKISDFKLERAS